MMATHKLVKLSPNDFMRSLSISRIKHIRNLANHGNFVQSPFGEYFFNHPDAIKHILQNNPENYCKKNTPYDNLMAVLGPGVLTMDSPQWQLARQRLQTSFRHDMIQSRLTTSSPIIQQHIHDHQHNSIPIAPFITGLIMNLMIHVLLGDTPTPFASQAAPLLQIINTELAKMGPIYRPMSKRRRLQNALKQFDDILLSLRPNANSQPPPLLAPVIDLFQTNQISQCDYLSEIKNFFIAGTETTASTMAWLLYHIISSPRFYTQVVTEINQVLTPGGTIQAGITDQMPYTQLCIEETMRMYPAIWGILRKSIGHDRIGNVHILPNKMIMLSPYTMHRHPHYWDHPESFMPERFHPRFKQRRPKACFIPFGLGPRVCIGKQLSIMTMKFILVHLIASSNLELITSRYPGIRSLTTLQPKKAIIMTMRPI
jgi:enediyne biosynthesis protein E7